MFFVYIYSSVHIFQRSPDEERVLMVVVYIDFHFMWFFFRNSHINFIEVNKNCKIINSQKWNIANKMAFAVKQLLGLICCGIYFLIQMSYKWHPTVNLPHILKPWKVVIITAIQFVQWYFFLQVKLNTFLNKTDIWIVLYHYQNGTGDNLHRFLVGWNENLYPQLTWSVDVLNIILCCLKESLLH